MQSQLSGLHQTAHMPVIPDETRRNNYMFVRGLYVAAMDNAYIMNSDAVNLSIMQQTTVAHVLGKVAAGFQLAAISNSLPNGYDNSPKHMRMILKEVKLLFLLHEQYDLSDVSKAFERYARRVMEQLKGNLTFDEVVSKQIDFETESIHELNQAYDQPEGRTVRGYELDFARGVCFADIGNLDLAIDCWIRVIALQCIDSVDMLLPEDHHNKEP